MSSSKFEVIEHQVPCSYIREYARGLAVNQEDQLYLSVKQYRPLSNLNPQPCDITIIGAHANAFAKETYEPLWDDLLQALEKAGSPFRIHSIWIADVAHQGQSYVMNEGKLGDDPSWLDHTRDLIQLINLHRRDMPRPIFGIGHSMGGGQLVNVALQHPRLLSGLILLDPVIQPRTVEIDHSRAQHKANMNMATLSTFRRDVWPSRDDARKSFAKSPFYQCWDPRVLDQWIEHGLRHGPTLLHPSAKYPQVTLTTPPAQEVHTFLRPNFAGYGGPQDKPINRTTHADLDPAITASYPFYRPEPLKTYHRLPELRPPVLYVAGGTSLVSTPQLVQARLDTTGVGVGGSGGAKDGRVKLVTLDGVGHLVAQEAPQRTAAAAVAWLTAEVERWRGEERALQEQWFGNGSIAERQAISEEWKKHSGGPPRKAAKTDGGSKL